MTRPCAITYLALLLTLCLLAGAVGAVGESQARLADAATVRNTVLMPRSGSLKSDCLIAEGEQIILLDTLGSGESLNADIFLEADRDFSGQLSCASDALLQAELDFALLEGEGSLSEDQLLELKAGARAVITLTVTAADAIEQAAAAEVQVTCGTLRGTFRVTLEADLPQEEPEETTEPTEPAEGSVDVILPGQDQVEVILPGQPGNPVQTTPGAAKVSLKALSEFEITVPLPVKATVSGNTDRLLLGMEGEPLLPMARYSADGGQSWYLLYDGGYAELTRDPEEEEESQWLLLLDLSMTEYAEEEPVCLEAQAFLGEQLLTACTAETVPRSGTERSEVAGILKAPDAEEQARLALLLGLEETGSDTQTEGSTAATETEEAAQTAEPTDTELAQSAEPGSGVAEGAYFQIPLPPGWAECEEIRYWAELLTKEEDGTIGYAMVEWDPLHLNAVTDPASGSVIVYMGSQSPMAGTYRLTLECMYEGLCYHRMQTTFFINYSTPSDARSEEVPENE